MANHNHSCREVRLKANHNHMNFKNKSSPHKASALSLQRLACHQPCHVQLKKSSSSLPEL
jgi:hypothetical protein